MTILLHICCGPCSIYPLTQLRAQGKDVQGYFYNPNIHPYREFKQRIQAVQQMAESTHLEVEIETEYGLTEYLRKVVFNETERCPLGLSPTNGMTESLYCWNCGECIDVCQSQALSFQWRQNPDSSWRSRKRCRCQDYGRHGSHIRASASG